MVWARMLAYITGTVDQELREPQKPDEQNHVTQPNVPVPPKQEIPSGQPRTPQPAQEKHDQEKRKPA
ncbi:MAG: hypothetical protein WBQ76_06165 [Candidatus Korobacteraceae bacterium]